MEPLLPKSKKKKKFCCFTRSDSSGDESVITIDRESMSSIEPVPHKVYQINNYASDRVYILSVSTEYFVLTVKHIILNLKTPLGSQIQSSRYTRRQTSGLSSISTLKEEEKSFEVSSDKFLSEKIQKKFAKFLNSRLKCEKCLISTRRNCSLSLHLAKYCHVVVVEEEKVMEEIVKNNSEIIFQGFKINLIEGNLESYEDTGFDLVVYNLVARDHEEDDLTSEDFQIMEGFLAKYLKTIKNIAIVLPYSADPAVLCKLLAQYSYSPSIEILIYSDSNTVKFQILLIGEICKVSQPELVQNLVSRLNLSPVQSSLIKEVLLRLGLKTTLRILFESENNLSKRKEIREPAQSFFEKARGLGCCLNEIKSISIGNDGNKLVNYLKTLKEFVLVYFIEDISELVAQGKKIYGETDILRYFEENKGDDKQSNSLLNLVEG